MEQLCDSNTDFAGKEVYNPDLGVVMTDMDNLVKAEKDTSFSISADGVVTASRLPIEPLGINFLRLDDKYAEHKPTYAK